MRTQQSAKSWKEDEKLSFYCAIVNNVKNVEKRYVIRRQIAACSSVASVNKHTFAIDGGYLLKGSGGENFGLLKTIFSKNL